MLCPSWSWNWFWHCAKLFPHVTLFVEPCWQMTASVQIPNTLPCKTPEKVIFELSRQTGRAASFAFNVHCELQYVDRRQDAAGLQHKRQATEVPPEQYSVWRPLGRQLRGSSSSDQGRWSRKRCWLQAGTGRWSQGHCVTQNNLSCRQAQAGGPKHVVGCRKAQAGDRRHIVGLRQAQVGGHRSTASQ